jgi:hypothetical protein
MIFSSDYSHDHTHACRRVNLSWETVIDAFRNENYDVAMISNWGSIGDLDPMMIRRDRCYSCRVYYTSEREEQRLIIVDREFESDS